MSKDQPNSKRRWPRWLGAWWLRPLYRAAVFLTTIVLAIWLVGAAQRMGWLESVQPTDTTAPIATNEAGQKYICPMMCTPPLSEPGRCPVCGMQLVPVSSSSGEADARSVTISAADRRLLGIKTVAAHRTAAIRTLRGVGVLSVDESRVAHIPAYIGGRIEKLGVSFTGQSVQLGDELVTLYSPDLFGAQTELLTLKQTRRGGTSRYSLTDVRAELVQGARERLVELGMTRAQIAAMENRGKADTRVTVTSPQAGTVTNMLARAGQYVKAGELLCEVADLTSIWLMTDLFPEEAALVRYGQQATAMVTSLPNQSFRGRVSFIHPTVNRNTRTVRVRIEIPNAKGNLRPGDEATVNLDVPTVPQMKLFDKQLADKWICPEHPDELHSAAGLCRQSGKALVHTADLGYARTEQDVEHPIVLPRSAVLMTGDTSAVYVETEPGRFQVRQITLGSKLADEVTVVAGISEGEQVATSGNFLIDSQMQLVGNPSLIDVSRAGSSSTDDEWNIVPPPIGPIRAKEPTHSQPPGTSPDEPAHRQHDEWQLPPITAPVPVEEGMTNGLGEERLP